MRRYHNVSRMWLTIPNLFTFVRILMTPAILVELARGQFLLAGWLFGVAAFTDVLDGAVARSFGGETRFGQYLDPIADKILLSGIYVGLAIAGAAPVWVVLVIFARDLWILLLSAIALRFTKFRNLEPSNWGKASTFLQIMTAVAVVGANAYHDEVLAQVSKALLWGVAGLAAISGTDYSFRGIAWLRHR
jgi:cardiolipin synthase